MPYQIMKKTLLIGSLFLSEHQASNVFQVSIGGVVDDSELLFGVCDSCVANCACQHVANTDDQVVAFIDEVLDVGVVVSVGLGFQVTNFEAGVFSCQSLQAFPRGLVKGLVVYTAGVGNHANLDLGCAVISLSVVVAAATCYQREAHNESENHCENLLHKIFILLKFLRPLKGHIYLDYSSIFLQMQPHFPLFRLLFHAKNRHSFSVAVMCFRSFQFSKTAVSKAISSMRTMLS